MGPGVHVIALADELLRVSVHLICMDFDADRCLNVLYNAVTVQLSGAESCSSSVTVSETT